MRSYRWRSQATRAAAPGAAIRSSAIRIVPAAARSAFSRAALLGGVWLGALATLSQGAAHATDGTWTGVTNAEWTLGTNWTSTPLVPDNTAKFDTNTRTSVTISSSTSINTIEFTASAPAYSFTINPVVIFSINGAGIVNSSAFAPSFTNDNALVFFNSGTAANAAITNNGGISFLGSSSCRQFDHHHQRLPYPSLIFRHQQGRQRDDYHQRRRDDAIRRQQ